MTSFKDVSTGVLIDSMTVSEWAKKHRITRSRVHKLIKEGRLAALRVGNLGWIIPNDAPDPRKKNGRPRGM